MFFGKRLHFPNEAATTAPADVKTGQRSMALQRRLLLLLLLLLLILPAGCWLLAHFQITA